MRNHIVVVDGLWLGHHPVYLKIIVKILLEAKYRVSVLCPDPDEMDSWVDLLPDITDGRYRSYYYSEGDAWLHKSLPAKYQGALYSISRWFHISKTLRFCINSTDSPDFVFFAWVDSYLIGYLPTRLIDWIFPYKWSGLYFHPRHLRVPRKNSWLRKKRFAPPDNFVMESKWASSISLLDAGIADRLRSKLQGKLVFVFPDFTDELSPTDDYHMANEIIEKSKGRKIISLIGGLARRKGLLTFIRIAKQSDRSNWYFVSIGKLMEQTYSKDELMEIKLFANENKENCFIHYENIQSSEDFNALVNVSDVIFAVYEDFPHSSNLVTKSAIYRKKVLVNTESYMAEIVDKYKLGEAVPPGNIMAAIDALQRLTTNDYSQEELDGMKRYSEEQSQDKLNTALLSLVESSLNATAS